MATRTYGLSGSGIDVDQMVKDLMKARRASYDKVVQKKTQLEWKRADYSTMYTAINDFRSNTLFNYKLQKTLLPKSATSSNDAVASATATSDAANVSHTLSVTQLASGVTQTSSASITPAGNSKDTLANQFGLSGTVTFKLTNGTKSADISIDSSKSIYDVVSTINKAGIDIKANYDATLDRFFLYTNNSGSAASIDFSGNTAGGLNFLTQTLKLNPVSQISTTGVTSASSIGLDATKAPLSSQFGGLPASFNLTIQNSVSGNQAIISVNPATESLSDVLNKINDPLNGLNTTATYGAGKVTLTTSDGGTLDFTGSDYDFFGSNLQISTAVPVASGTSSASDIGLDATKAPLSNQFTGLSGVFNLKVTNGTTTKTIAIDTSKSLNQLISDINTSAGLNAQASYDAATGKFSLKATSGTLDLTGSDTAALDFLSNQLKLPTTRQGTDAQFSLDGVALSQTSNNFTISGVTYNLKATGAANISVTSDNDKAIAAVKSFVEAYNTTLSKINGELSETYYKDFLPLTDEQKNDMKEADIKAWEEKAKSGLLRRDSTLQEAVNKMRSDVYSPISGLTGQYTSMPSIGITTGDFTEGGKLYLDENKLKSALEADPDIVYKLFGTTDDDKSKQGVAVRLYDTLKTTMDKLVSTAGVNVGITVDTKSAVAKQLVSYNQQLFAMNDRLTQVEDRYYKQFDAMETALNRLNQQSSWLAQQFK